MVRKYVTSLVALLLLLLLLSVNGLPQTETDCSSSIEAACQRTYSACRTVCTSLDTKCQEACAYARGVCR